MDQTSLSPEAARAWLSPLLFIALLALVGGCAQNRSLLITPTGTPPQEDAFPRIVAHADRTSTARESGFEIAVHYAPEQEAFVAQAVEALRKPVRFLGHATGLRATGKIEAYLYPLDADQEPPHHEPHGRAAFTAVFFVTEGKPLFSHTADRQRYLEVLPHELAHTYLSSLPLSDRWLEEDGLAEYLKRAFVRSIREELPGSSHGVLTLTDWNVPLEALRRVEWGPWSQQKTNRLLKIRHEDPALAAYLGQQEIWNYAAATELVERWMNTAREAGIKDPVRDLVQRIQKRKGRIQWADTQELVYAQTGRSVQELTVVTEADEVEARQWAWSERLAPTFPTRLRALRTLTFLGLPEDAVATDLLPAFDRFDNDAPDPHDEQTLAIAASGAVAAAKEPKTAVQAADILRTRFGSDAHRFAYPALWPVVADSQQTRGLTALVDTVRDPRVGLDYRKLANESLEALTGKTVDWSVELSPTARQEAALRWTKRIDGAESQAWAGEPQSD